MVRHIVMWKLNDGLNKEETALLMKEKIEALKDKIDVICDIELGMNFKEADTAADVVLVSTFKSKEDLKTYIEHPEHVKVGAEYVRPNVSERRSADYEF